MKENPPYKLFQAPDGKWGTKDADGNVCDQPIYLRVEHDDGGVTYFDGYTGVCDFNPETGMDIIAWYQPWWEDAFLWAKYPDEYNDYLWRNIKADRQLGEVDARQIAALIECQRLTAEQHQAISDLVFYCRWNSLPDDGDYNKFEEEWFSIQPLKLTPQQRVDCLVPLMQGDALTDELKSTVWYANFCFIDTFFNRLKSNDKDAQT